MRRTSRRAVTALILLGALAAVPATSQAQTDPKTAGQNGSPPANSRTTPWADAGRAAEALGARFPNAFAGVGLDPKDQKADIYVVRGSEAVGAQLAQAAGKYARVHVVERSYASLIATRDRILGDLDWLHSIGLQPTVWAPAVDINSVHIDVPAFTPEQEARVKERFGKFVYLEQTDDHFVEGAGRWADSQPWWGGDTITRNAGFRAGVETCTVGPILRNFQSGNVYALTAAHCGPNGSQWYNNVPNELSFSRYVGQQVGTDPAKDPAHPDASNGTDSAIIYSNAGGYQWTNTGQVRQDASIATQDQEPGLCVTGSLSGEQCGATVVYRNVDACVTLSYGSVCNVIIMQRDGYPPLAGQGDSGAAVYSYDGPNGLYIRGIYVAYDYTPGHRVTCQYWATMGNPPVPRQCSDKVIVVGISRLEQNWYPSILKIG